MVIKRNLGQEDIQGAKAYKIKLTTEDNKQQLIL